MRLYADLTREQRQAVRKVVCAACYEPESGIIFCGPRHFDEVMRAQVEAAGMMDRSGNMIQGFVDQHGIFMERELALVVVLMSGQPFDPVRNGGNGLDLYSEGLY